MDPQTDSKYPQITFNASIQVWDQLENRATHGTRTSSLSTFLLSNRNLRNLCNLRIFLSFS
jgi:hypothetical protein